VVGEATAVVVATVAAATGRTTVVGDTTAVPLPHETAARTTAAQALPTAPVHHIVTATVGRPDLAVPLS